MIQLRDSNETEKRSSCVYLFVQGPILVALGMYLHSEKLKGIVKKKGASSATRERNSSNEVQA